MRGFHRESLQHEYRLEGYFWYVMLCRYFQKVILSHIVINYCKKDKVAEVSDLEEYGNLPGKPNTLR